MLHALRLSVTLPLSLGQVFPFFEDAASAGWFGTVR